ncbi:DNA polymerase III subunit chi [Methylophilus sp. 3sh_L]|uniref:DNA polymerase III subunit chi n=1 Tax=Methylophilus sp. 3sh_L TaxID=3377114 RepID=UPI00398E8AAA
MTKIRFYTDVPDTPALMQHLILQAVARQRSVTVYLPDRQQAEQLSATLWQQPVEGFLPHVLADADHAPLTPVHLAWAPEQILQDDLLFNCQTALPKFFSRFRHVFEVIGQDETEKAAGRQRWAFYRDRGYEIQHIKSMQSQA